MNKILKETFAVALRDLKRKSNLLKNLFNLVFISALILGLGKGLNLIADSTKIGQSYDLFFSSGLIGYFIVVSSLSVGMDLVMDKRGFNKLLLIAPISRISILFGKALYLIINGVRSYFLIAVILMISLGTFNVTRLFLLIPLIILILIAFLGISFLISAFITKQESAQNFLTISVIISLFFSGIVYNIKLLPSFFQYLFYFNPATYAIEIMRYAITGETVLNLFLSFFVLITMAIVFSISGVYLYDRRLRKGY